MKNIVILLFILPLVTFCNTEKKHIIDDHQTIIYSIPNIRINDSVIDLIDSYMNNNSQFDKFLIIKSPEQLNKTGSNSYLIGPCYEGIFQTNEFPLFYFEINNKKLFIYSGIESIINALDFSDAVRKQVMIQRGSDSLINKSGWVIKNGDELFIHRALHFAVNKDGTLEINYSPDTIVIPKLVETIEF